MTLIPPACRPAEARWLAVPESDPAGVAAAIDAVLPATMLDEARDVITSWDRYDPTPLHRLSALAGEIGVGTLLYKDESTRFGLASFKALGGAYAVFRVAAERVAARTGVRPSVTEIEAGRHAEDIRGLTVCCATDGNHGRSVAWGARRVGCRCVIYVHEEVSRARRDAIAVFGAEVRVVTGGYNDSVRRAAEDAGGAGWTIVSDTSWPGYDEIPRLVMAGYMLMADEAFETMGAPPSHVFVQGGVGGLAAAVAAAAHHRWGPRRPLLIVAEPENAACLLASAEAGRAVALSGACHSLMAGLACGEPSMLAWRVLAAAASGYIALPDHAVAPLMRRLADPPPGEPAIVAGESAVAGVGGLAAAMAVPEIASAFRLGPDSRVLVFGTEGATDPDLYRRLVGHAGPALPHPCR
ncbi:MAG: diaminopropionate ammonia-lyase [Alphaproteobacteria bacterium]|nr:diaminopropionate ammonia-lyase [Alphaproteobacteria bacterium]